MNPLPSSVVGLLFLNVVAAQSFEPQMPACGYAFPVGCGAAGDPEGISVLTNGAGGWDNLAAVGGATIDNAPNALGFPCQGNQYARIEADAPVGGSATPPGGPYAGDGMELFIPIGMPYWDYFLCWDFYSAEGYGPGVPNDGMSIDVLDINCNLIENALYVDAVTGLSGPGVDGGGSCGTNPGTEIFPPGANLLTGPLPGSAGYIRIAVWNGGNNLNDSVGVVDAIFLLELEEPCSPAFGLPLGAGDDWLSAPLPLGFAFPFAGGSTSTIQVSSNGFVWLTGGTSSRCCNGNVTQFLNDPPSFAALWTDLDPTGTGDVYFNTLSNPNRALITWSGVREFGQSQPFDMQVQLVEDGHISVAYNSLTDVLTHQALVGVTQGGGAAAYPVDFSFPQYTSTSTAHEMFGPGNTEFDLPGRALRFHPDGQGGYIVFVDQMSIGAVSQAYGNGCGGLTATASLPILGTTPNLEITGYPWPSTVFGLTAISLTQHDPGLPIGGAPGCELYVGTEAISTFFPLAPTTTLPAFTIPVHASWIGVRLYGQAAIWSPGVNPLGVHSSNGLCFGMNTW